MLADIEFIHRQIKVMGKNFDRRLAADYVGRSLEFVKGVLWQKEREQNEKAKSLTEKSKND